MCTYCTKVSSNTALSLFSLSNKGEISVLGHLNKTAPSSTIVQFIIHLGEISVLGHLNKTAPGSTIVQFIIHLGEISVLGHSSETANWTVIQPKKQTTSDVLQIFFVMYAHVYVCIKSLDVPVNSLFSLKMCYQ